MMEVNAFRSLLQGSQKLSKSLIVLEQCLYRSERLGGFRLEGRSPGFRDEWLAEAQQLCSGFGKPAAQQAFPGSVFARPLARRWVCIVQVAAVPAGNTSEGLRFHFLVLGKNDYRFVGGDPFLVARQFPAPWPVRGDLPSLTWPQPPARRTVEEIQRVLEPRETSATLLGGCQALLDGGHLVLERSAPEPDLVENLWTLLPTSTRSSLWPASYAFGNELGFDVLVVPRASGDEFAGYLTEQQAGDYPEGRYELALQIAAEAGDQRELDALFARRSRAETWRIGALLLGVVLVLLFVSNALFPSAPARLKQPPPATGERRSK
jgi:hypothetical protein